MTSKAIIAPRLFDGTAFRDNLAVVIHGARIEGVVPVGDVPAGLEVIRLEDGFIAPGFIDVQVNGGGGVLFNDDPSAAGIRRIAEAHRRFGTIGLLPTVITDAPQVLADAIAAARAAWQQRIPGMLGIHIEGPFLDVARKGAHEADFIRDLTAADIDQIAAAGCGAVMLTLAPNQVRPELVKELAERAYW